MKKVFVLITLIILVMIGTILIYMDIMEKNDTGIYPNGGRDTVEQFGNRRIVILSGYKDYKLNIVRWILYDRDNVAIDNDIYGYKEISPYVYTFGSEGYIKMNYNTGEYEKNDSISKYQESDRVIFERLKNGQDGKYPTKN